jgi:hypothetical protein
MGLRQKLDVLIVTLIATVMMVILGLIYFVLTLLVIKGAANIMFTDNLSASWGTLAAALVTGAVIIAGALEKKKD